MLSTIFVPTFLKTLAVVCGIGGGLLAVLTATVLVVFVTQPLTKKIKK